MGLILFTVEASAGLADLKSFRIARRLKYVARFQQQLARVSVDCLEPLTELLIVLRIIYKLVYGIDDDVRALPVSEAFEQYTDLSC